MMGKHWRFEDEKGPFPMWMVGLGVCVMVAAAYLVIGSALWWYLIGR